MFCQRDAWTCSVGCDTQEHALCGVLYTGTNSVGGEIQEKGTGCRKNNADGILSVREGRQAGRKSV